jgi:hypothetical protein
MMSYTSGRARPCRIQNRLRTLGALLVLLVAAGMEIGIAMADHLARQAPSEENCPEYAESSVRAMVVASNDATTNFQLPQNW